MSYAKVKAKGVAGSPSKQAEVLGAGTKGDERTTWYQGDDRPSGEDDGHTQLGRRPSRIIGYDEGDMTEHGTRHENGQATKGRETSKTENAPC